MCLKAVRMRITAVHGVLPIGYDRSGAQTAAGKSLYRCNQCNPHCPQSIDIPKELHRIDAYVEQLKQETL